MLRANILLTALPVLLARLNAAAVWVNRGYAKFGELPFHALRCIKVRERAKAARTLALGSSLRSQLAGSEAAVAARRLNPASSDLTITGTPGSPTCFICSTRASLGVP